MKDKTKFEQIKFEPHPNWVGVQGKVTFKNGYGASIIRASGTFGSGSYGAEEGLYELAVLQEDEITYATPITDDVMGFLSEEDVSKTLLAISKLPLFRE